MQMNFKRATVNSLVISALAVGAAAFAFDASAATATSSMTVSAEVQATCTISITPIAFATYDAAVNRTTDLLATGTVTTTCTSGLLANVMLSEGAYPFSAAPTTPLRQMGSAANRLAYFLYSDSIRSTVWGATVGTGLGYTGTGNANAMTIYGTMPAGQNVPVGSYSDTVVATVTF